ncbi:MAG: nickel transporter [Burkholderiales bacterium]
MPDSAALPHDLVGLVMMVFLLGMRHGMDPDHLATVDGLARRRAQDRPGGARWSGCFFSLGHGAVVTLVAGVVAASLHEGGAPQWLERAGAWISAGFLLALGVYNIVAVLRTPAGSVVRLAGFRGRWLGRLAGTGHPAIVAMIGAAFALSFDTFSQAALFSLTGAQLAGWPFSVALGLVFTLGMMIADGVNGLWVARMIERADRRARVASRVMGLSIAFLGIAIAGLGTARLLSPQAAAVLAGAEPALGFGVAILVAASFAVAMRLAGARPT